MLLVDSRYFWKEEISRTVITTGVQIIMNILLIVVVDVLSVVMILTVVTGDR